MAHRGRSQGGAYLAWRGRRTQAFAYWRAPLTAALYSVSGAPARATLTNGSNSLIVSNNNFLGTANLDYTFPATVDATGALVYARIRVRNATGLEAVSIFLRTGPSFTSYGNRRFLDLASHYTLDGEWYEMWCPVTDLLTTGSPNFAAVDHIRISAIWSAANTIASFEVAEIGLYRPPTRRSRHAITLDDGNAADYAVAQALQARRLVGTFYVVPSLIGTPGYLTLSQLGEIRAMGHLIANHSWSHLMWADAALTLPQRIAEVRDARAWMAANGFAAGANHFAQPGGSSQIRSDSYGLYGAEADTWRMTASQSFVLPPNGRQEVLWTHAFDDATAAGAALNRSIAGWGDTATGWHPGSVVLATFTTYADAVAAARDAGQIDVVTVADL